MAATVDTDARPAAELVAEILRVLAGEDAPLKADDIYKKLSGSGNPTKKEFATFLAGLTTANGVYRTAAAKSAAATYWDRDILAEARRLLVEAATESRLSEADLISAVTLRLKSIKKPEVQSLFRELVAAKKIHAWPGATTKKPLYATQPPPPELGVPEVVSRLIGVIRSQRLASADSYPVAKRRLFQLAELDPNKPACKNALKDAGFAAKVATCKAPPDSFVLLADLEEPLAPLVARALEAAAAASSSDNGQSTAFAAADLASALLKEAKRKPPFSAAIERAAKNKSLAAGISWIRVKDKHYFFRPQDVEPVGSVARGDTAGRNRAPVAQAPTSPNFAAQFDAAFARIDAGHGRHNHVRVLDLRQELSQFSRADFDSGLRQLRIDGRYTMDSAHGLVSEQERQAGIQEGSSLLVYVARK